MRVKNCSIAANVTHICGDCCKDHIIEASTVVKQEFANEASSSEAKWWIEEAAMEAGKKASTIFVEILTMQVTHIMCYQPYF